MYITYDLLNPNIHGETKGCLEECHLNEKIPMPSALCYLLYLQNTVDPVLINYHGNNSLASLYYSSEALPQINVK